MAIERSEAHRASRPHPPLQPPPAPRRRCTDPRHIPPYKCHPQAQPVVCSIERAREMAARAPGDAGAAAAPAAPSPPRGCCAGPHPARHSRAWPAECAPEKRRRAERSEPGGGAGAAAAPRFLCRPAPSSHNLHAIPEPGRARLLQPRGGARSGGAWGGALRGVLDLPRSGGCSAARLAQPQAPTPPFRFAIPGPHMSSPSWNRRFRPRGRSGGANPSRRRSGRFPSPLRALRRPTPPFRLAHAKSEPGPPIAEARKRGKWLRVPPSAPAAAAPAAPPAPAVDTAGCCADPHHHHTPCSLYAIPYLGPLNAASKDMVASGASGCDASFPDAGSLPLFFL
jgi:hypothetical protein